MNRRLMDIHEELTSITAGCRDDMHEPDEQELNVRVVGDHLDNACGAHISEKAMAEGYQEFVVCFVRYDGAKIRRARINLADLIALARTAQVQAATSLTAATV